MDSGGCVFLTIMAVSDYQRQCSYDCTTDTVVYVSEVYYHSRHILLRDGRRM